jgi:uncharacterized protein
MVTWVHPDNSDAELEAFDQVCHQLGGFEERVSAEWADGYLTALAAGPRALAFEEWLPKLAGDAFERAFADPEAEAQARQALMRRVRVLATQLDPEAMDAAPEVLRLRPLVAIWDDAARQRLVDEQGVPADEAQAMDTGVLWAEGFFDALVENAAEWQHPPRVEAEAKEVFEALLVQVQALLLDPESRELQAHLQRHWKDRTPTRDDLFDEACFAIQDLRMWWVDHAPRPETRRVEAAPGRNDPCPCGSGLKFKKCHGKAA